MTLTSGPHLSASETKRKGEGVRWAGGEAELGQLWAACARRRKRPTAWGVRRLKEKRERKGVGSTGKEGREGFLLFFNSFQIRFSNFQTSIKQETMHSNHDAQALIISKFY
jgi:hypothetical protein